MLTVMDGLSVAGSLESPARAFGRLIIDKPIYQSSELGVPFSFLMIAVLILCAVASPLVAAGVICALRAERWRYAGERAGITGGIIAAKFIATYVVLHLLFGNEIPIRPVPVAVAGGAGFTAGALLACAWSWMRSTRA